MPRCPPLLLSVAAVSACLAATLPYDGEGVALATVLPFLALVALLGFGRYPGEERIAAVRRPPARAAAADDAAVPRAALVFRPRVAALLAELCLTGRPPPAIAAAI